MIFLVDFFFIINYICLAKNCIFRYCVGICMYSKTYSMSLLTLVINYVCNDLISDNFYHPDGGKDASNLFPMHGQ